MTRLGTKVMRAYLDGTPCGTEIVAFGHAIMNPVDGMALFDLRPRVIEGQERPGYMECDRRTFGADW